MTAHCGQQCDFTDAGSAILLTGILPVDNQQCSAVFNKLSPNLSLNSFLAHSLKEHIYTSFCSDLRL